MILVNHTSPYNGYAFLPIVPCVNTWYPKQDRPAEDGDRSLGHAGKRACVMGPRWESLTHSGGPTEAGSPFDHRAEAGNAVERLAGAEAKSFARAASKKNHTGGEAVVLKICRGGTGGSGVLATAIVRFQRVEHKECAGKAGVNARESGETQTGVAGEGLAVEQLVELREEKIARPTLTTRGRGTRFSKRVSPGRRPFSISGKEEYYRGTCPKIDQLTR